MIGSFTLALALLAGPGAEEGQGRPFLHPLFTDHVVLQRDAPLPIWGWAEPGSRIKVALAGQSVETTADDQGKWLVKFGPYPAGGPHTLSVSGPKTVEIRDILVGDVWICSGQSNMEWPVNRADRPEQEIAAADHPRIRLFTVPKKISLEPQVTVDASWEVCSPETVGEFSAVGYFFGKDLERELNVPIGLIDSSWGGTIAEAWVSDESLTPMGDFDSALGQIRQALAEEKGKTPLKFEEAMAAWWKKNDPGSSEDPNWSDLKFDAKGWQSMELPGHWEEKGLPDFDGIAWFRKEFELPEGWADKELTLSLGAIDDRDTTWINGVEVGHMNQFNSKRDYKVPAGVAKASRNVIAVRVLDTSGQGGFAGSKEDMKLTIAGEDNAEPISLAGPWSYKASTPLGELSTPPESENSNPNRVTVLYNGMIAPLKPFPIKGAIWYQGESNAGRPAQYRKLLPTLIRDWREKFGVGEFPFLIVQLANYMKRQPQPANSNWAELREAQYLTTKVLPRAGVALAIDIGDATDIHPTNKQEVGRRLALDALAIGHGKDVEFSGPVFKSLEIQGNKARLSFDHVGAGLVAAGGDKLEGFAIAGEDGQYHWADATIDGDTVVVSSTEVEHPKTVRYAWADNPACNLYNQDGLPAVPFRSDPPSD
ncbi:sialate O-acetylesterase [Tundrisphaera lichenicola]|uniref:sialate O-acetylesterase n=1 Tax=Tundrisphaera lichenicola TaxID=2029860 RepID=UPI003EBF728A